jgi:heptaprenyl diphosphate synthase
LEARVLAGVEQVEKQLAAAVDSPEKFVAEAAAHLLNAGGKRFRPLLVMLSAEFGESANPDVARSAVVVELTHLATLYHDDVMDEATLRRGASSANSRWGNAVAILTGDFLFARASDLLADLGPECVRIQARTFERLVQGQIRETVGPVDGEDAVEHYLRVLADKTGSLIGTSGRFGAMLSGTDEATVEVLARFGERIGVAFQLSDDILDIASDTSDSGKSPGTDLREGVRTLPVLLALRDDSPDAARLRELLAADLSSDALLSEALVLLRSHPSLSEARAVTQRWADEAREALQPLPDGPAKDALLHLCELVVGRTG